MPNKTYLDENGNPTGKQYLNENGEPSVNAPVSLTPGSAGSEPTERFVNNALSAINPFPGMVQMGKEAADPQVGIGKTIERHVFEPMGDQLSKSRDAFNGRGEFAGMSPLQRVSETVGHGAAGMIPLFGPAAANAGDQIGSGDIAGGLGGAAGLIGSVAVPDAIHGTGKALMRGAEPIMEHALRIKNIDRAFGKTPGRFALDETSGVTNGGISNSAGRRVSDLTNQVENLYSGTSAKGSLQPARDIVDQRIRQAQAGNSEGSPELGNMKKQLTEPVSHFSGAVDPASTSGPIKISDFQDPATLLRMKREFGKDFTTWSALHPNIEMPTARGAYNAMDQELDRVAPEGAALNQRISSGIPVARAAEMNALRPGLSARLASRAAARTGALTGAIYGGATHGLPGAVAGFVLPELAGDPVVQAIAARGMNGTGRAMATPSVSGPVAPLSRPTAMPVGRAIQLAPNVKKNPDDVK
jgi:hypothetical protein